MRSKKSIVETLTALIVFLFMYTSLSKLMDYDVFVEQLGKSPLLGPIKEVLAIAIPAIELFLVVLLTLPKTRMAGLKGSFILLSGFTLYLIYMVSVAPTLPCTCGGVINQMSWTQHIFFNIAFIAMSAIAIRLSRQINKNNIENTSQPSVSYS